MAVQHMVRRGDSLWSLASQYLGNGTRWPEVQKRHNQEVARRGQNGRLIPIENEHLIYVGQTVFVPSRQKAPDPDNGNKAKGRKRALPVNFAINYVIGRDTPPIMYAQTLGDYTVKTEMSGKISIEMASPDRYRHSLELLVSKSHQETRQKLYYDYDPALCALTAKPEMVYESGRVRIEAPIAAQANAGPYIIQVQALSPNHMSGSIKTSQLSGTLNVRNRKYKYTAEIELKADVIWHPGNKSRPEELVKVKVPTTEEERLIAPAQEETDWKEIVSMVTLTLLGAALMIFGMRMVPTQNGATTIEPFLHLVDPHDPRNRRYMNNNA